MSATPIAVRPPHPVADLARWMAVTLVSILTVGAGLIMWRWSAGALVTPLSAFSLTTVGLVLTTIVAVGRLLWRYPADRLSSRLPHWSIPAIFSTALVTISLTLSLPGSSLVGLVGLWGLVALEECWAWGPNVWQRRRSTMQAISTPVEQPIKQRHHGVITPDPIVHERPDREVTQQLTRSRTADGGEFVSGWLRVSLAVGQRSASLHVAFCPPFGRTPRTSIEQVDGPEVRVKKVQVLPYGARFDLKRKTLDDTPAVALLKFTAETERVTPA